MTICEDLGIKIGRPLPRKALKEIERQEREWYAEIRKLMKEEGMDFDTAWCAAGGMIVDLSAEQSRSA